MDAVLDHRAEAMVPAQPSNNIDIPEDLSMESFSVPVGVNCVSMLVNCNINNKFCVVSKCRGLYG
jgi:hypothetical protein